MAQSSNGKAVTSMVSGIIAWLLAAIYFCASSIVTVATLGIGAIAFLCGAPLLIITAIGWVLAIVMGHLAKREIRQTDQTGGGMATAGLAMGYTGIVITALAVVFPTVASLLSVLFASLGQ